MAVYQIRKYFHCGWSIAVSPDFEYEYVGRGETLRIHDATREVSLSSTLLKGPPGLPFRAQEVLDRFPPPELKGRRFTYQGEGLVGVASWVECYDDSDGAQYVLYSLMISEALSKFARCTIVCTQQDQRPWALAVWQSILLEDSPFPKPD